MSIKRPLSQSADDVDNGDLKKIKHDNNSRQPARASLLGLPAELRNRIYELVFGDRVIHIRGRKTSYCETGPYMHYNFWPEKLSRTVCQVHLKSESWTGLYERSKRIALPTANQQLGEEDIVTIPPRKLFYESASCEHGVCRCIHEDFHQGKYTCIRCNFDETGVYAYHERSKRTLQNHGDCDSKALRERYGPPPIGQRILQKGSQLRLGLLSTCRQIYEEAALIPCATNIFTLGRELATVPKFSLAVLSSKQAAAITTLQVDDFHLKDPCDATKSLPSLNHLRYIGSDCECSGFDCSLELVLWDDSKNLRSDAKLETVEVILEDGEHRKTEGHKSIREAAARMEEFLLKFFCGDEKGSSEALAHNFAQNWQDLCRRYDTG